MKDLLGVTGDGLGGAAESGWRPDRILSKRIVNLVGTAAAAAGLVLLSLNLLLPSDSSKSDTAWADVQDAPPASAPPVTMTSGGAVTNGVVPPATQTSSATQDLRSYAIELTDLYGLPPDTAPGTAIELWATWNSEQGMPGYQKVIKRAVVERLASPIIEDASPVVILQVSKRDLRGLLWADRYGSLGAVLLPQAPISYPSPYLP